MHLIDEQPVAIGRVDKLADRLRPPRPQLGIEHVKEKDLIARAVGQLTGLGVGDQKRFVRCVFGLVDIVPAEHLRTGREGICER